MSPLSGVGRIFFVSQFTEPIMKRESPLVALKNCWRQQKGFSLKRRLKGNQSPANGGGKRLTLEQLEGRRLLATLPGLTPELLADLTPGQASSVIKKMASVGDRTFFVLNDSELWSTQGKAGDPQLVADFRDGNSSTFVNELTEHAGKLVFRVQINQVGAPDVRKFLYYDPQSKEMQTWMTLDSTEYFGYLYPDFFVSNGSDLFFTLTDYDTHHDVWKANSDLTETTLLQSFGEFSYVDQLQSVGGPNVVFSGEPMELWKSDGTVSGTQQLRDITAAIAEPFEYAGIDGLNIGQLGSLATADFDGDGATDFAVPGRILFGDGQGGVLRSLAYGDFTIDYNWQYRTGIQAIDFDLDGDQDIAVALAVNSSELRVFRNDGLGQFTLAIQMDLPGISVAMATGSVDATLGDDLLVAIENRIYRLTPGDSPVLDQIAVATQQQKINRLQTKDLDGDGLLDIVTSESDRIWSQEKSRVTILKQSSFGSFVEQSRTFLSTEGEEDWYVEQMALADWNGDGREDLIVGQNVDTFYYGARRFGVILQTATGYDGPVTWNSLPGGLAGMQVAPPVNGDGGFLLIGVRNPSQWLVYPLAENLPLIATPIGIAMDGQPSSIATGDFNGDGLTDFAMGDQESRIVTYTNFNGGSFGIYPSKPLTGEVISSVAYRNPGNTEDTILTLSHIVNATQISRRGAVSEWASAPAGYVPELVLPGKASKVLAESLQGAPEKDLLLLFPEGPYVSIFQDGSFLQDQRIALGTGAQDMATGDWNSDGRWDLAVSYPAVHRIVVYEQNELGVFAPSIIRNLPGGGEQLLSVDIDGDGDNDLLTPDSQGEQLHILQAVSGGFLESKSVSIPGGPQLVQFADMDHVGQLDLVATTTDLGMIVALRDATGNVYLTRREEMASAALDLDLADISGDGWTDVIVTPSVGSQALVYYGALYGEVGYAIPQWVGVGMRQMVIGSVEDDALPGLFMLLQTIPSQVQNQATFGYVVEMRPNSLAHPITAIQSMTHRDPEVEASYFLTYADDEWQYYMSPSFHLPGTYASIKEALWKTDGTPHGTTMVYDFQGNYPQDWFSGPNFLVGLVYNSTTLEMELWTSDGTSEGTKPLRSFFDLYGFQGKNFVAWNGKIYFAATTSEDGTELWETDGTVEGTKLFYDFFPGASDGLRRYDNAFLKTPSGFYFTAVTEEHGAELWFSDGTSARTVMTGDIQPGPASSDPADLHWDGKNVLFSAFTKEFGREPWALGSVQYDFGDAPDSYGTLVASDGPRHRLGSGLYLGYAVDTESDGAPGSLANKDDTSGIADEDAANTSVRLVLGVMNNVTLVASGLGFLDLWLDLDQDGNFSPDEHFTQGESVLMEPGENTFQWMLPAGTLPGITYARLRFSATGGLLPTGEAVTGEVEDHRVVVRSSSQSDWQNPRDPYDTNYSGDIKPSDALVVINYLNSVGQGLLPPNPGIPPFWYDVNGDGSATPLDALRVINYLNLAGAGGEGESSIASMLLVTSDSDLAWPFASAELIGGPSDFDDSSPWDDLEIVSEGIIEEVVLGGAEDTSWELSGPVDDRAYSTATETVDQVMSDAELEAILMATPPLQTQLSSFWMELRKRMAGRI